MLVFEDGSLGLNWMGPFETQKLLRGGGGVGEESEKTERRTWAVRFTSSPRVGALGGREEAVVIHAELCLSCDEGSRAMPGRLLCCTPRSRFETRLGPL